MIGVDMKGLIDKCNMFCTTALHTAAGMAVNAGHYEVTLEHVFLTCLEEKNSDISLAMTHCGGDIPKLQHALHKTLEEFRSGNSGRPVFSPLLQEALEAAWLVSSVDLQLNFMRSGALLMAFLRRPSMYAQGSYSEGFSSINRENFRTQFHTIVSKSVENAQEEAAVVASGVQGARGAKEGESFLARFCEDFTAKARNGTLDAVFGRDQELRQMIDILARRRKNNPILVGEPGVGKTAVMEGLALRIVEGDVPETLQGVTLLGLDMGLLEAGASVKGEFERRLKGVLDEIKASPSPIILFIDEAHLLVGAGNAAGGSDAANLMKPALARGEIRTCAATTWKEYKKYFEKDPALARRFQLVKLDEPSVEATTLILRGIRDSYEKAHCVLIRGDALQVAAEYAGRYIQGRFLPDKAIDLLDTACARVKVNLMAKPAALEDMERGSQAYTRELKALERDKDNGIDIDEERVTHLTTAVEEFNSQAAALRDRWQQERDAAHDFINARDAMHKAKTAEALAANTPNAESPETHLAENSEAPLSYTDAQSAFQHAQKKLEDLQSEAPLIHVEVTPETIGKVVSDWTGIPVGKLAQEQASMLADLENTLAKRIKGQAAALRAVSRGIQESKAGLRAEQQPIGIFLLVGPSGVGKTETGLALADALFGDERCMTSINMSEFQERHTVSRLVGSPPGYVGYGEGGMLTEAVRRRPYSVVLLDEVEKAHTDVMQLFYQVFDKGTLTDGEGTEVSFRNTVLLLTSNLASDMVQSLCSDNIPSAEQLTTAIRPILSQHFQPALLARMSIVPYTSLKTDALMRIATLKLDALGKRLFANHKMRLVYDEKLTQTLAMRCSEVETGARNLDAIISAHILPLLSRRILENMASKDMPKEVRMEFDAEGSLEISFGDGLPAIEQEVTPQQEEAPKAKTAKRPKKDT